MKIYTINEDRWKIEFMYSPLFEVLCSLHVLLNPEHHLERILWAKEMKDKLPLDLQKKLVCFGKMTCDWLALMDFCNSYEECDDFNIMTALDFLEDLEIEVYHSVFGKYKELKEIPFDEAIKKEMIRLIKEYYLIYFERELRFIEPLLIRSLKRDFGVCSTKGTLNYVNEIHSRIQVTEEAFLFHKYTLYTIPFNKLKRLIIRVSSFISPHLLMDYGEDMVQFTTVTHIDIKVEKVPIDLLRLMKALSDETRLKIIRSLRRGRASTQSLALELNLSEAGISKHLKILYDTELLYKEREGCYIYYYLNTFFIDRIPLQLYEYLD